jgi:hypothetical protein
MGPYLNMLTVAADSLAITQDEYIFDLSFMSYISLDYTVPLQGGGDYVPPALPFPHPPFPPGLRPKFHPCAVFD